MNWTCWVFGHKWVSSYFNLTSSLIRDVRCKRCGYVMPNNHGQGDPSEEFNKKFKKGKWFR